MLNNTKKEEINNWINSGMDYEQGFMLLSKYTKNRVLLKKRNIPLAKIEFELKKMISTSQTEAINIQTKTDPINRVQQTQRMNPVVPNTVIITQLKKKRTFKNLMKSLYQRSIKFRSSLKELIQCIMICIALALLMIMTLFEKEKKF